MGNEFYYDKENFLRKDTFNRKKFSLMLNIEKKNNENISFIAEFLQEVLKIFFIF